MKYLLFFSDTRKLSCSGTKNRFFFHNQIFALWHVYMGHRGFVHGKKVYKAPMVLLDRHMHFKNLSLKTKCHHLPFFVVFLQVLKPVHLVFLSSAVLLFFLPNIMIGFSHLSALLCPSWFCIQDGQTALCPPNRVTQATVDASQHIQNNVFCWRNTYKISQT